MLPSACAERSRVPPGLTRRVAVPPELEPVKKVAPPALVMMVAEPAVLGPRKAVRPPLLLVMVAFPAVALPRKAVTPTSLGMGAVAPGLVRASTRRVMLNEARLPPLFMNVALPADAAWLNVVMPPLLLMIRALAAVLEPTKTAPLKKAVPPVLIMTALAAELLPRKPVTPPSLLVMTALPALAAFVKLRPGVAATTPPLPTVKVGALAELLTMPAPLSTRPAVWLVVPKVKACAPALKVKPPRVAGAENVMPGRPEAPKKAVPVGTLFGSQLAAALKLLVTQFQVAFCARTPGARPRSHSSKAAQAPAL